MATRSNSSQAVKMRKVKTTPGTVMFLADDDSLPITNLYFRKATLDKLGMTEQTENIEITVKAL